jgi:heme/copper-type cytochrome/quinol oxidase subunit 4
MVDSNKKKTIEFVSLKWLIFIMIILSIILLIYPIVKLFDNNETYNNKVGLLFIMWYAAAGIGIPALSFYYLTIRSKKTINVFIGYDGKQDQLIKYLDATSNFWTKFSLVKRPDVQTVNFEGTDPHSSKLIFPFEIRIWLTRDADAKNNKSKVIKFDIIVFPTILKFVDVMNHNELISETFRGATSFKIITQISSHYDNKRLFLTSNFKASGRITDLGLNNQTANDIIQQMDRKNELRSISELKRNKFDRNVLYYIDMATIL